MSLLLAQTMHTGPAISDGFIDLPTYTELRQTVSGQFCGVTYTPGGDTITYGIGIVGLAVPWHSPFNPNAGDFYQIRYTRNSGNVLSVGTEGTWVDLDTNPTFGYNVQGDGNFTIEIRNKGTLSVLATQTVRYLKTVT